MIKKLLATSLVLFFTMGFFKIADAHVTLNPKAVEPESYERVDVRVPVEQKDHTDKIELEVPKEAQVVNIQPVEGYKYKLDKDKKGNITKITWKAKDKGIGPDEFMDFPLVVASPKEEGKYTFKAIQSYDNGDKVKWTGKEDSEHPAPTLEVKKDANATTVKEEKSNDTASEQQSSGGSIALWIVSIIAIILSLVALFKHSRNK
ncbi:DUF1775 domain-containing protein [Staphylococcus devriesei]|uniref:DUF1775 domain-containing protein n=1 Tax=Staphylococcus devriesei TaxID=586733 RepID=A0A2K4DTA1_9STAP|nr:YcnI family protein [Staphylococcus devriesei]MCE5090140.1 YcnI family protein [Staphylococcus devriesei]MCE5096877.1 YcnI family protein [Staphylococcus devriesei]PNZ90046.1 nuclear export factor GLE1 [Staphylococcus devriesei]PTE74203.1 DUF1775 domain-containing protein [Staphylococcus devriesei]PTF15064.1 DUF1775 domain-containing protein [Staphylococcus devriesei]